MCVFILKNYHVNSGYINLIIHIMHAQLIVIH